MVSVEIQLHNPSGLHLRPAGKSVLSVLSACIKTGDVITMICDGSDETEALEDLRQVIQEGLGEL